MRSAVTFFAVVLLFLTIGGNLSEARIRNVPNDYETIQEAINAAAEGDTVLVQPETYVENINFLGKNIVVASLYLTTKDDNFITRTIIDGDGTDKTVSFRNGEGAEAVLCGFTIRNGFSTWGGGIYCDARDNPVSPTLDHLVIHDNEASRYGGGLYATQEANPTLINVTVANNTAGIGHGGIGLFQNSSATIVNSIFWGNTPFGMPGGLEISYSDIERGYGGESIIDTDPLWTDSDNDDYTLTDRSPCIDTGDPNSPEDRDASRADMGAYFYNQGNVRIFIVPDEFDSINEAIDATEDGDTVLVHPGTYTENISFLGKEITIGSLYLITNDADYIHETIIDGDSNGSVVTFDNNETAGSILIGFTLRNGQAAQGGGILCSMSNPTLIALEIENNIGQYGGGIYLAESDAQLRKISIIQNNSNRDGSGISCYNSNPTLTNCTIARNSTRRDGSGIYYDEEAHPILNSCILWGNDPEQIYGDGEIDVTYSDVEGGWEGNGNIDANPLFADPDGGGFQLSWENWRDEDETKSPCIDTGDPDLDNDPENTRADMGAYYWHQEPYRAIIVVDPQALDLQINTGENDILNFNIANEGDTLLIFETDVDITLEPEQLPRRDRRGGPDGIEYEWRDNDEEDGPDYNWIDVSNREGVIEVPFTDDSNRGPYQLGFGFNFYGDEYNTVRMCSNGWASFTSSRSYFDFSRWDELPAENSTIPDLLAVAMTDWNPTIGGGEYYFWSDEETAVMTWENIPHASGLGRWSFQIILYSNGMIRYQYSETGSPDGVQLVGVQNNSREYGFEIIRNEDDYIVDGRAIGISRIWPEWISVDPIEDEIDVDGNIDMDVIIHAEELVEGDYAADIHLISNDPENPDVIVAVSVEVIGIPSINIVWDNEIGYPDIVDWNSAYENVLVPFEYDITLDLINDGTASLQIDSINVDNELFVVEQEQYTISPNDTEELTITFSSEEENRFEAIMTVYSNDPERQESEINLVAEAILLAPVIEVVWSEEAGHPDLVDWNAVYDEVYSTVSYDIPITIRNTGRRDLEIIEIVPGQNVFSANANSFVLQPNNEREVTLTFEADNQGEFATNITIRNNTEDNPDYLVSVHATALNPPIINLDPESISDSLYIGWTTHHDIELANNGEAPLVFTVESEIISDEEERDNASRTLRSVGTDANPRRDNAGDRLEDLDFNHPVPANQYKNGCYDPDDEWFWFQQYNAPYLMAAIDPTNGEEMVRFNTGLNPMDLAYYDGVIYIMYLWVPTLNRYDIEGNNLGQLALQGHRGINGIATDQKEGLIYAAEGSGAPYNLNVFTTEGEMVGQLGNVAAFTNNQLFRSIEFVALHPDGELWVNTRDRAWQIDIDTDNFEFVGNQAVVNFATTSNNEYAVIAHDGENLYVSCHANQTLYAYDDGVIEAYWLTYEPEEGNIEGGGDLEFIITLDARGADEGFYEADITFLSNDPHHPEVVFNVRLVISEPPNLVIEWDSDYGFPGEVNWNDAYPDLYNDLSYDIELTFLNYADDALHIEGIDFEGDGNEFFSVNRDEFTIDSREQTTVTVTFEVDESGTYEVIMNVHSDAEDLENYPVELIAETHTPPQITLNPEIIEDDLITGETADHNLNIANEGESPLTFEIEPNVISEPGRDNRVRSLRSIKGSSYVRRDDPGDIIDEFTWQRAPANCYKSGIAWDADNDLMWLTNYNNGQWIGSVDPNDDYREVGAFQTQYNLMNAAVIDGIIWAIPWASEFLARYDRDGNNKGNVALSPRPTAMTYSAEEDVVITITDLGNPTWELHVYEITGDNRNELNEIAHFPWREGDLAGRNSRSICWVDAHPDGQLWINSGNPNRLASVSINTNDWEVEEVVQDFDIDNVSDQWCGVGHDGENIWLGPMRHDHYTIIDDGIAEISWIIVEPDNGEINGERNLDVTVTLDADGLIGGNYEGELIITSNDLNTPEIRLPVNMSVDDAPDISVEWDDDFGYPDEIDWNLAFEGLYRGQEYEFIITVISSGVTDLEVASIRIDDDDFSPNLNRLDLAPDEQSDVELLFEPDEAREYNVTLTFESNSEAHPELRIPIHALVENAPAIEIDPLRIETTLMLGGTEERSITVTNEGDAILRFDTDLDIISEPERDSDSRVLRRTNQLRQVLTPDATPVNSPRRDDVMATYRWARAVNGYKHASNFDTDNEWMWVGTYSPNWIAAISWDGDYENFTEEIAYQPQGQNVMDVAWMDGVVYNIAWSGSFVGRHDAEGENLGNLAMGFNSVTALAASPENGVLIAIEGAGAWGMYVVRPTGNNVERVATINWRQGPLANQFSRGICWVDEHPDGQLWINIPNRLMEVSIDTDDWSFVEVVQNTAWNNGGDQWSDPGHDGENLWLGNRQVQEFQIVDDGITELYWFIYDPQEGELGPNENMNINVIINATDLVIGDYTAELHFESNDPFNPNVVVDITLHVEDAPDIGVTWEFSSEEEPDLVDWNLYHQEVYFGYEFRVPLTVHNVGDVTLTVEDISADNIRFTATPTEFDVRPGEERDIEFIFSGPQPGEYAGNMTITSNDPDETEFTLRLHALASAVPRIRTDAEDISEELEVDSRQEQTFNIENIGAEELRWWSEFEVIEEPQRNANGGRDHGQSASFNGNTPSVSVNHGGLTAGIGLPSISVNRGGLAAPRRDALGDEITSFTWNRNGDNRHKAGITWDKDNQWMWLTCYNNDYLGAIDPTDNYDEVIAWAVTPQHPMSATYLNGVIYVVTWGGREFLGRWDADGNNLGNLDLEITPTALTSTDEYLLIMNNTDELDITIMTPDGDEVAMINDYRQTIANDAEIPLDEVISRSIEWINLHPDGELWINTIGHIWQVSIDHNWESIELVQDFEWLGNQEWDGIGHDGENLWLGPWNQPEYYIVDDSIEENRWVTIIPARGILDPDDDQDVTLTLNATDQIAGNYEADLHILSNDPNNSDIEVNVRLLVRGDPNITVEPEAIDFDEVEHGTSSVIELTIRNDGYSDLTVSEITIEGEFFSMDFDDEEFVIRARNERIIPVEFAPAEDRLGDFGGTITITSDSPNENVIEVDLTGTSIHIEHPPEVISEIEDQNLDEDFDPFVVADLDTVFNDRNGDVLSYIAECDDENFTVEIVDETLLRLDSDQDWHGTVDINVTADDHTGDGRDGGSRSLQTIHSRQGAGATIRRDLTGDLTFSVTVNPVNDAPIVENAIPAQEFNEDEGPWNIVDLDNVFSDVDGDDLEFQVAGPGEITLDLDRDNLLTLIAPENFFADNLMVIVSATDGDETGVDTFYVTIIGINDPPEVQNPVVNQIFVEDTGPWEIIDLDEVFFDIDRDELTFEAIADDPLEAMIDDDNLLSLDAPENFNGVDLVVTITANDNQGGRMPIRLNINPEDPGMDDNNGPIRNIRSVDSTSKFKIQNSKFDFSPRRDDSTDDEFEVDVTPANDPPVWDDVPETAEADENELIQFDVSGSDVDGDDLTIRYSSDDLPDEARFADNRDGSGRFTWQTDYFDAGDYTATFTLSDGQEEVDANVEISVSNVNREPDWTEMHDSLEVNENELLEFTVSGEDPDLEDVTITYRSDDIPDTAEFAFDGDHTGRFSWETTYDDEGDYTATFTLSDGDLTIESDVAIRVIGVNRPPVWDEVPDDIAVNEGVRIQFTIEGIDADGDDLTIAYNQDGLPDEADFTDNRDGTGDFDWQTDNDDEGNYTATFTLSDGQDQDVAVVNISVGNVNRPPHWDDAPGNSEVAEGALIEFSISGSDPDGEDLTITPDIPEGAEFEETGNGTGDFTWQTFHDDAGDYTLTFTLSDDVLERDAVIQITVNQDYVIDVPDEYETIQAAIYRASDGDTVLVQPDTYIERINFIGKDIAVIGNPENPSEVVIDGDENGSVVTFNSEESENAVLTGFTITNGTGRRQDNERGGGIYIDGSSPTLAHLNITYNTARVGGGLFMRYSNSNISNILVANNESPTAGGMGLFGSDLVISDATISYNSSTNDAGGMYLSGSDPLLRNVLISGNSGRNAGGLQLNGSSHPILTNVTIVNNMGRSVWTGGIFLEEIGPDIDLVNTIVRNNTVNGESRNIMNYGDNDPFSIEYCNIEGGEDGIIGNVDWGEGNIDFDPLFADPDNDDYNLTWENYPEYDDSRSPCIDTGDPDSDDDPDGTRADMGAYYFEHEPAADISVEPEAVDFDDLAFNNTADEIVTISNVGSDDLTITNIDIDGEGFEVQFAGAFDLAPGEDHEVTVTFEPDAPADFAADLIITSNDPNENVVTVTLTGTGINVGPEVENGIADFERPEDFDPFVHVDLSDVFTDANGDELVYSAESDNENLIVEIINGSELQLSVADDWNGDAVITVTADDNDGEQRDRRQARALRSTRLQTAGKPANSVPLLQHSSFSSSPRRDLTVDDEFTITVTPVNDPPYWINLPDDPDGEETDLISFIVTGADIDGDDLTIIEADMPEDAVFTDYEDGTGNFRWRTDYDDAGEYQVTLTLSDGEYDVETDVWITIGNVNRPPVLEIIDNKGVNEGEELAFTLEATDPDDDSLTFSAENLPEGAELNGADFSWTPFHNQAGSYDVTFIVTDDGAGNLTHEETITITVVNVNRPPVLSGIGSQEVNENEELTFTLEATDPDDDGFVFSAVNLPEGAELDSTDFSWTPGFNQAGGYDVTFIVTDDGEGELTNDETITITVLNVNRAPEWDEELADVQINENEHLALEMSGSDPDGSDVSFDFSSDDLPEDVEFTDNNDGTASFDWDVTYNDAGEYTAVFTISDDEIDIDMEVDIIVINVNRPPVVANAIDDVTIAEDPDPRRVEIADLNDVFSDPDDDELSFDFRGAPDGLNMGIDDDNILYINPNDHFNLPDGVEIIITADDNEATVEVSFTLTINAINDAPVWDDVPDEVTGDEEELIEFTVSGSDVDSDNLRIAYSSEDLPDVVEFEDLGGGEGSFTWQTTYADAGNYTATFTLSDRDTSVDADVIITLSNVNRTPTWTVVPDSVEVNENEFLQFTVEGNDPDEEDDLTIEWSSDDLPDNVEFIDISNGVARLAWQTTFDDEGDYSATFVISDGEFSDETVVAITVIGINRSPVWVDAPEDQQAAENSLLLFTISGEDPDDDALILAMESEELPEAAGFTDNENGTGTFRWQTSFNDEGNYSATFTLSDGDLSIESQITISVGDVNRPPFWIDPPEEVETTEDEHFVLQVDGEDPDGDNLIINYRSDDLPEAAEFEDVGEGTATLTWDTNFEDAGQYIITFILFDDEFDIGTDVTITVINVNRPPVVAEDIEDQVIDEDPDPRLVAIVDLDDVFNDPDGDELLFDFSGAPDELNMGININHVLYITPDVDYNLVDGVEITVTADDSDGDQMPGRDIRYNAGPVRRLRSISTSNFAGGDAYATPRRDDSAETTFTLTITPQNDPPVWDDIPETAEVSETELIEFTVSGSDVDSENLTIVLTSDDLPEAAAFEDQGDGQGLFTWETTHNDAGTYTATFTISDGDSAAVADVALTVYNVNRSPYWIDIPEAVGVEESEHLQFTVEGEDPDGDDITIEYSSINLPEAAQFTDNGNGTGSFDWQTTFEDEGEYRATLTLLDGDLEVVSVVRITISHGNRTPVWTDIPEIDDASETDTIEFIVTGEDPDLDNLTIQYQSDDLPEAVEFTDNENGIGRFYWITGYDDAASYTATFIISDGNLTDEAEVTITVLNVNRPPIWVDVDDTVEIDENELLELTVNANDPDDQDLTLTYRSDDIPEDSEFIDHNDNTGTLTWLVGYDYAGENVATFIVTDGDLETEVDVTILVSDVNRPPEIAEAIDNIEIAEDPDPQRVDIANLNDVFIDPDGDDLSFDFIGAPDELNMDIDDDNVLFFNPNEHYNLPDAVEITVTADDERGERMVVRAHSNSNDKIETNRDVGPVRQLRSVGVPACVPARTEAYAITRAEAYSTTPRRDDTVDETFTITISPQPDPPVWIVIPEQVTAVAIELIQFTVEAMDPDGDDIEISAIVPEGANFTDNGDGTGLFRWRTDRDDDGNYVARFTVTDGEYDVVAQVAIRIDSSRELTVQLLEDWNLISVNVYPDEEFYREGEDRGPDIWLMIEQWRIDEENHIVLSLKDEYGRFCTPAYGWNGIPYWDLAAGYQIRMREDTEGSWTGTPIPPDEDIPIGESWNIIPYYPDYDLPANRASDLYVLASIIDHVLIVKNDDGQFMTPGWGFSNMVPWTPGEGYQIEVDEDLTFSYPEPYDGGDAITLEPDDEVIEDRHWETPARTSSNMSVLVNSYKGVTDINGCQIAAFNTAGQLVGLSTVVDGACGIAVWGNDVFTDEVDGLIKGEAFSLKLWNEGMTQEFDLTTTQIRQGRGLVYKTDDLVVIETAILSPAPETFYLSEAYPNPFNAVTRLSYGLTETEHVSVRVFDLKGRLVTTLIEGESPAGDYEVIWNSGKTPSGIYLIKMETSKFKAIRKVSLVK
ncbi:MAG: Ig-like domain-containing protein [Candidatus Hatepunaea meridiana]|nr:Ig-like domain-containing protein [Candidatus Hatepunaea meridiana]